MADAQRFPKMKPDELYREDAFTDRHVGAIRRLTPVTANGEPDLARKTIYVGSAEVLTPAGPLPLSFEIEATTLAQAVEMFSDAAEEALQETMREIQKLRREQSSGLVIPDARDLGGLGGLGGLKR